MPLSFEEEIRDPSLVEEKKNDLANEEELLVEKSQVEEQHPRITIEIFLVRIDKFNFLIDFGHGRGPTNLIYRKTFHYHKSSLD